MRNLKLPVLKVSAVLDDCVRSVGSAAKRADLSRAKDKFVDAEASYVRAAKNEVLFQIPVSGQENEDIVFGGLTKADIKNLYSGQMVRSGTMAREHYDKLLLSSPLRKCPFCGFGRVTTLDHFLNKADYPWLAIVPVNLVPACMDCNHGKGTTRADSSNDQTVHPYFEGAELTDDQWLFAKVLETTPMTLDYRAEPPATWDKALRKRIKKHFDGFNLKARFSVEASTELGSLRFTLKRLHKMAGRAAVVQHLSVIAAGEAEQFKNSWKTALFQALAESDWYVDGGYLLE